MQPKYDTQEKRLNSDKTHSTRFNLNNYFFPYAFLKGTFESSAALVVNKNFYDFMLYEDIGNSASLKAKQFEK